MSEKEIPKHIRFISTVFDFSLHSRASRSCQNQSVWGTMRSFMQRFVANETPTLSLNEGSETGMPRYMTTLEKRLIQDCVMNFYIRVKTVKQCHVIHKEEGNPFAGILETARQIFIGCFNSYLSSLDGLYLEKYGIVNADELRIENGQFFSELLQKVVDLDFLPKKVQRVANIYLSIMNEENMANINNNA